MSLFQSPAPYNSYQFRISIAAGVLSVKVFYNSVGNIVWTKDAVGRYLGTLAGAFPNDKTFILPTSRFGVTSGLNLIPLNDPTTKAPVGAFYFSTGNVNAVKFEILDNFRQFADIDMDCFGELRVYP